MDMIPIIIFSGCGDDTLPQMLKTAVQPFAVVTNEETGPEGSDFFIKEVQDCTVFTQLVGIAVFQKSFLPNRLPHLPKDWIAVVDSDHDSVKAQFCKTGQIIVTYGTKPTDTFSISGLDGKQASISLQRTVKAITGAVIEPCEITMTLTKPYHPCKLLPVAAVLLLAGIAWNETFIL